MENKREHSKFIIQRFDSYTNGINTKGSFLLAINTFLIGVIITNYNKVLESIDCPNFQFYYNSGIVILIILCLVTTFYILKAVYPFLISGNSSKDNYHSHIFFNSIAEFNNSIDFSESIKKQTDNSIDEDMNRQAYYLAKGLKNKFHSLEMAMIFIYAELTIIILLLILIILFKL